MIGGKLKMEDVFCIGYCIGCLVGLVCGVVYGIICLKFFNLLKKTK